MFTTLTQRWSTLHGFGCKRTTPAAPTYGPWSRLALRLGTESAWAIPLNELFDAKVIVFWSMCLPHQCSADLVSHLYEIPKIPRRRGASYFSPRFPARRLAQFFSLGVEIRQPDGGERDPEYPTCYLNHGRIPAFGDRLRRQFFFYAGIAILLAFRLCYASNHDRSLFRARRPHSEQATRSSVGVWDFQPCGPGVMMACPSDSSAAIVGRLTA